MLESSLKDTYGDTTLGSDKVLTGLCTEEDLNSPGLSQSFKEQDIKGLAEMGNARNCELLYETGSSASLKQVKAEHLG
jgi:hypothetical protein